MGRNLSNKELSDLANKVLKGKASIQEYRILDQWYSGFDDSMVELEGTDDKEAIRRRILSRINAEIKKGQQKSTSFSKYAAAVVFIILSGISFLWIHDTLVSPDKSAIGQLEAGLITKAAGHGQWLTVKLPDGSTVKLNGGSSIKYPEQFKQDSRNVTLIGEAFFDVVLNQTKPFTIESRDLKVRVLGTSFNFKSYEDDPDINVAVKSGSVLVSKISGLDHITLQPKEMAVFHKSTASLQKEIIAKPDAVFGWIEGELVFDNESFEQVIKKLSRWYGVDFIWDSPRSTTKRITSNSANPTLGEVLESLSHTYDFEYEITGKRIIIK